LNSLHKIQGYIKENKQCLTDLTRRFIQFKTVTPELAENPTTTAHIQFDRKEFVKFQEYIQKYLADLSIQSDTWTINPEEIDDMPGCGLNKTRDYSNMPVLAARIPGSGEGRSLILNGHYDVVQPGNESAWEHNPFDANILDDRIIGRGACDMKGGLAAMLFAVKAIRESGIRLKGDIIIETVPDEEATSMGTLSCCARGYTADAALIPEPTDMNVLIAVRGVWSGRLTVPGRAGHAEVTQPHWKKGGAVNAIMKSVFVIQELHKLNEEWRTDPDRQHPYLDPEIVIPTVINGGNYITNYPESVSIGLESMFLPGNLKKHEELEERLKTICACDPWLVENPVQLERSTWLYSAEVKEEEPIAALGMEILKKYNKKASFAGMGSLTDAIHLINYSNIPTISIGPSFLSGHQVNESVSINDIINTSKVIAELILKWCGESN